MAIITAFFVATFVGNVILPSPPGYVTLLKLSGKAAIPCERVPGVRLRRALEHENGMG